MSPPDEVLELVFSFLLVEGENTKEDPQRTSLPVCLLLQTRRMHGFDHVKLAVCRRGLDWAMRTQDFGKQAAIHSLAQQAAPILRSLPNCEDSVRHL